VPAELNSSASVDSHGPAVFSFGFAVNPEINVQSCVKDHPKINNRSCLKERMNWILNPSVRQKALESDRIASPSDHHRAEFSFDGVPFCLKNACSVYAMATPHFIQERCSQEKLSRFLPDHDE
jgi:hypothetical protein